MKRNISRTILLAAAALFLGTVAYGQEVKARVVVPFDFVVAGNVLPAGDYVIRTATANTFALSIMNDRTSTLARSYPCTSSKVLQPSSQTKLVFHRINDTYFLYQVWSEGSSFGRQFPKGRVETEMARKSDSSEVVIAAASDLR